MSKPNPLQRFAIGMWKLLSHQSLKANEEESGGLPVNERVMPRAQEVPPVSVFALGQGYEPAPPPGRSPLPPEAEQPANAARRFNAMERRRRLAEEAEERVRQERQRPSVRHTPSRGR